MISCDSWRKGKKSIHYQKQSLPYTDYMTSIHFIKWKNSRAGEHSSITANQSSDSYCQKQLLWFFFFCTEAAAGTLPAQQLKVISNPTANCECSGWKTTRCSGTKVIVLICVILAASSTLELFCLIHLLQKKDKTMTEKSLQEMGPQEPKKI